MSPRHVAARCRGDDAGSMLPLLIGFLALMMAVTGLVVDIGYLRTRHLMLTTVAEQVALAASRGVDPDAEVGTASTGTPRLSLALPLVRSLALQEVARQSDGWVGLRVAAVTVRQAAAQVQVCARIRLPLDVSVPNVRRSAGLAAATAQSRTMCASAAAAMVVPPPQ